LSMMKNDFTFDFLKNQNYYLPHGSLLDMKKNREVRLVENDFKWGENYVGDIIPSMA
jgi:hypothetical protein